MPARLTPLLLAATRSILHHGKSINADANLHRSPNAGWSEAAMAYALVVALAGPRSYEAQIKDLCLGQ